jgi:orotidine-5'-phosphate decarboxylase
MSTFYKTYQNRRDRLKSLLCVGLDPDLSRIPEDYEIENNAVGGILRFFSDVIEATGDLAVAYKPNLAFF